jgi:restriction system protein
MPVPNFQRFLFPVLKHSNRGEVRMADIKQDVAIDLSLSETDMEELVASGTKTAFDDRIAWAKAYLKQAGLVQSTRRAFFTISSDGKKLLESGVRDIDVKLLTTIPKFMDGRERQRQEIERRVENIIEAPASVDESTPEETIQRANQILLQTLSQDILERLRVSTPAFFERVVVRLLLAMGYGGTLAQAGKAIGRSGDNGVDGVIDQDTLGLDRVYVQAKRYAQEVTVGPGDIRDFFGSLDMHKASKGLFVTTSSFTKAAMETAEKLGKRIVLIDGSDLTKLMIRFNVGCRVEDVFEIKRVDEEFFE